MGTCESNSIGNTKRIAKNTILLYLRMFFIMAITLYTSRVVLNALGVEDFGIYNVVGGAVAMLGFFSTSLSTSTQRFLNYEMGLQNSGSLKKVFSNALNVHFIIGAISLIAFETIGLWFVCNKLNVSAEQINAAIFVYHFSVLSFFTNVITTPYTSAIIASEEMGIYAYLTMAEAVFKLGAVYILSLAASDRLVLYAVLIFAVNVIIRGLFAIYCIRKFDWCRYFACWDFEIVKKLFSFCGWMFFGCTGNILSKQGVNILINLFYGSVFNASYAIAMQVQAAVNMFSTNFMTAVCPQIIKSYSAKANSYMYSLVFVSSKLSYYLLFLIVLPTFLYADYILRLWLGNIPEYCTLFTRLTLLELLVMSVYLPISQVNQASGNICTYQISIFGVSLLTFVSCYILFCCKLPVYAALIVSVFTAIVSLFARLCVLGHENGFPVAKYVISIILPMLLVSFLSSLLPVIFYLCFKASLIAVAANCVLTFVSLLSAVWLLGMNSDERKAVVSIVKNKLAEWRSLKF